MAITIRSSLLTFLLVVLAACTFDLVPTLPQDDPVPEESPAEDAASGSDTNVSIDWTAVADSEGFRDPERPGPAAQVPWIFPDGFDAAFEEVDAVAEGQQG